MSGSPGSLPALYRAVRGARRTGAEVPAVLAWEPAGGELAHGRSPLALPLGPTNDSSPRKASRPPRTGASPCGGRSTPAS
ncbi:hypothetical protein [Streptomyces sp. NBC_01622]|uniref:hypothetical protein n=1 Tax=Streptomyces sp. NBC_01622 TaxID=2975903 RepID=UPI0038684373